MRADRDTRMWVRLEADPGYRALFQRLWFSMQVGRSLLSRRSRQALTTAYPGIVGIVTRWPAQVAADVAENSCAGGDVAFIRFPSSARST